MFIPKYHVLILLKIKKKMKPYYLLPLLILVVIIGCQNHKSEKKFDRKTELITEGKRLVNVLGCNDCHSPKKLTKLGPIPDENLLLSGYRINHNYPNNDTIISPTGWILFKLDGTSAIGPWGTSYAPNLTPHETGIGNWTLEQFTTAMREGKYKGLKNGRTLLPPMPWIGYKDLKDNEVKAIFEYLKSIKPIKNIIPPPLPPKR